MRDFIWNFGTVASGAVNNTAVYCPNPVDTGALTTGTRFTRKHIGADTKLRVVGQNEAVMATGDYFCMFICDDSDNSGYTEILRSENTAAAAHVYTRIVLPLPESHRRYVNAGFIGGSASTLTTKNLSAWLEEGPNIDQHNI